MSCVDHVFDTAAKVCKPVKDDSAAKHGAVTLTPLVAWRTEATTAHMGRVLPDPLPFEGAFDEPSPS